MEENEVTTWIANLPFGVIKDILFLDDFMLGEIGGDFMGSKPNPINALAYNVCLGHEPYRHWVERN